MISNSKWKKSGTIISTAFLAMCSVVAIGAEGDIKSVRVGPMDLTPLIEVSESYSDNIFWNNLNRKGSMITQIRPGLQLNLEHQLDRYALNYTFNSMQFHSSPHDNFVDHYLGGQAHMEFSSRHRLNMDARFIYAHNQRGTVFSQGVVAPNLITYPDEYIQTGFGANYRYGVAEAPLNLELLFNLNDYTYQNHRDRLAQWDRTETVVTPGIYYRLFPSLYLAGQVETTFINYKNDLSQVLAGVNGNITNLSYDKERYLLGTIWNPTEKTNARIKAGYLQQNFIDKSLPSLTDFTWDIGLDWMPRSYSRVNVTSSRDVLPTFGAGFARLIDNFELGWTHDWTDRFSSRIYGTYQHADNKGATRVDDYYGGRIDIGYRMQRWLGLGVTYTYLSQISSSTQLNYDQNVVMFYISGNPFSAQNSGAPWKLWYGY
jgi:polysaccharide biosynthesis protein VpsM